MQLTISSYLAAALVFAAIGQALPLEQVHEAVLAQVNAPRGGGVFPASVDKTLIKIEYPEVEALLPSEDDKVISGGLVLEGGLEGITAPARRASAPADIELQNNVARKYHGPPPRQPGIQVRANRIGAPPQPENRTAKRASAPSDIELQNNVARKHHGPPRLPGIYIPPHGKSSAAQEAREPAVLRRRWLPGGVWHEGPGQHWP